MAVRYKQFMLMTLLFAITFPARSETSYISSLKLFKCSYKLRQDELITKAISRLVTSVNRFPIQTFGKSGWLEVTERLNGPEFNSESVKPGDLFELLIPEENVGSAEGISIANCGEIYYLLQSEVRPYDYNVANVTSRVRNDFRLDQQDVVKDFQELQKIMPLTARGKNWYFLMRFKKQAPNSLATRNIETILPLSIVTPDEDTFSGIPAYIAPPMPPAPVPAPVPPPLPKPQIIAPKYEPYTAAELTPNKIAALPPAALKKIDPIVVEKKANEISFLDSLEPGMDNLFSGMKKKSAARVVGLRFGYPLVSGNTLAAKIKTIGFLIERRGDFLKGLRYAYDFSPRSSADNQGTQESFSYARHSLGWAFEIPINYFFNQIHIIPRLGSYKVESEFAVPISDLAVRKQTFRIKNGLAIGWEFDVEKAAYFSILRLWLAQDVSGQALGLTKGDSVSSLKTGLDASFKGAGFNLLGADVATSYTAFLARDSINLSGENEINGKFVVAFEVPMAGLGIGLTW